MRVARMPYLGIPRRQPGNGLRDSRIFVCAVVATAGEDLHYGRVKPSVGSSPLGARDSCGDLPADLCRMPFVIWIRGESG
jgi:hypothetical protein